MEEVSGANAEETVHDDAYGDGNVRPPVAETTPLTVSASLKDGGWSSGAGVPNHRRSSRRPSLDTDEFINLLHGSDLVKLELNRFENEVRDKERELSEVQAKIKALKLLERLRRKRLKRLYI